MVRRRCLQEMSPVPNKQQRCERQLVVLAEGVGVIYESGGSEDMSGLVQNYRPLRVFGFLYPSLPLLLLYSLREKAREG